MPNRTPREAVRLHLQQAQRLAACVTDKVLRVTTERGPNERQVFGFPGGPADLAGVRLRLLMNEHFRTFDLAGRHTLIAVGYRYSFRDAGEHEILSYHWHPHGQSRFTQPHLHLGAAAQVRQRDLASAHLPTGVISLADVIELAIESFGVVPRVGSWRNVIAEARANR